MFDQLTIDDISLTDTTCIQWFINVQFKCCFKTFNICWQQLAKWHQQTTSKLQRQQRPSIDSSVKFMYVVLKNDIFCQGYFNCKPRYKLGLYASWGMWLCIIQKNIYTKQQIIVIYISSISQLGKVKLHGHFITATPLPSKYSCFSVLHEYLLFIHNIH